MKKIIYLILFFFGCCHTDFFLSSQRESGFTLIEKAANMWALDIEVKKLNDEKNIDNVIIISRNLACQETEIVEYADFCQEEIVKIKRDYNEIMGFCLTENDENGWLKRTHVIINDAFFYSLHFDQNVKINVVAHEIGHCLGLGHTLINKNIMYPFQENGQQNFHPQRTILKNYYHNKIIPTQEAKDLFFQNYEGNFLRHEKIPLFYVKL